jgi:hypothetical protein
VDLTLPGIATGQIRREGRGCHGSIRKCMLKCMQSTSVRIDVATHDELKRLASSLGTTVGATVALAVRRLRQERIGEELTASLSPDEVAWLDAELG